MGVLSNAENLIVFRLELNPKEVPILLKRHGEEYKKTKKTERTAKKLIAYNFSERASAHFVTRVYWWSRMCRNLSRVQEAGAEEIAARLREAYRLIAEGRERKAIEVLCQIPHLGLSYASKIARFLDPERCVVLDKVIRERLGYSNDFHGYVAFLEDCREALKMLKTSPLIDSEFRASLRICDVEAALFMKAKELNNVSP